MAVLGRYAFFTADPLIFGITIYDLANPSFPQFNGTLNFAAQDSYKGTGVAMDDQYVYQTSYLDNFGGGGGVNSFGPGDPTSRLSIGR